MAILTIEKLTVENESSNENSERCPSFLNTIQDCFLHQHVIEPTRYTHGEELSLLDLVLSNEEGMVYNLAHEPGAMAGNVPNRRPVRKKHQLYKNAEAIRLKNKKQKQWKR